MKEETPTNTVWLWQISTVGILSRTLSNNWSNLGWKDKNGKRGKVFERTEWEKGKASWL